MTTLLVPRGAAAGEAAAVPEASSAAGPSQRGTLPNGSYQLANHPDGRWPVPYGLIVGGLVRGDARIAFDFEAESAEMVLKKEGRRIRLFGRARAQHLRDGVWHPGAIWHIDALYDTGLIVLDDGGIDDIQVTLPDMRNRITLTDTASGQSYHFLDKANHLGFSFQLGDKGGRGHRLRGYDLSAYDIDYSPGGNARAQGEGAEDGNGDGGGNGGGDGGDGGGEDDDRNTVPVVGWGWLIQEQPRRTGDFLFIIKKRIRDRREPQDG